jgi:osmoprotectant transport system permease protein
MSRVQRLRKVEVPLAMPVILTGIRVATVTTVGLVGISVVIQLGGLATYIFDGFKRSYSTVLVLGTVAMVLLAVSLDLFLRGVEWVVTPWARRSATR